MNPSIFISHSSAESAAAQFVRAELRTALEARGYEVFADDEFRPGELWRPRVDRWLAESDGAVLVLTPPALDSEWVRKEATILSWRRALRTYCDGTFVIIAVLIDGVTPAQVRAEFSELGLEDGQFMVADAVTADEAAHVANEVAQLFPPALHADRDGFQRWTFDVAAHLAQLNEHFLAEIAEALVLPDSEWRFDPSRASIAACLLHAEFNPVYESMMTIQRSGARSVNEMLRNLAPLSISESSAATVVSAMVRPLSERVVAINAHLPETAEWYVERATCCDISVCHVRAGTVTSEDREAQFQEVFLAIARAAGAGPHADRFRPEFLAVLGRRLVVFLRTGDGDSLPLPVLADLLARLRATFPSALFVVTTGSTTPDADDLGLTELLRVLPPHELQDEMVTYMKINGLLSAGTERAS